MLGYAKYYLNPLEIGSNCNESLPVKGLDVLYISIPLKSGLIVIEVELEKSTLHGAISIPLKSGLIVIIETKLKALREKRISIPLKSGLIVICQR